jgi:translocation protein SEC72
MVSDDSLEFFDQISLSIDPSTKAISSLSKDKSIQDAVTSLNALHTSLKSLDTPTPPPPVPVNPKRSGNIAKMRDSANAAFRKGQFQEAIRLWNFAIDMASGRPAWEPMGLQREELAALYLARSNSHVSAQNWVEGWKDAELSKECKKGLQTGPNGEKVPGNPKSYLLGGKCLMEMSRWSDAVAWFGEGLEVEGEIGDDGKQMVAMLNGARKEEEKAAAKA